MKKNIIKVKKFQKTLMCLLIILVSVISYTIGRFISANADEINYEYESNNIDYDNSTSNLNATNVKDAIDELYEKVGKCPSGYECLLTNDIIENDSSNIIKAYIYDENSCITGDETACKRTICYLSNSKNSCPIGTILDYKVNNETTVRFHVLHDDGKTITLQSQKNTLYRKSWYSPSNDASQGPQTIMEELKNATDSWTNVNPITITSSTTSFTGVSSIDNLCTRDSEGKVTCSGNVYDIGLISGTYRARMITMQEATDPNIGQCKAWVNDTSYKSCRPFINNFLIRSNEYCKNSNLCIAENYVEGNEELLNYGYWTMGTNSSEKVWRVNHSGYVHISDATDYGFSARAVIVVNKEI